MPRPSGSGRPDDQFVKELPANLDAERAILGAILLDNTTCDQCVELDLKPDDFFLVSHQELFRVMLTIHEQNLPVDLVTLSDQLRKSKTFSKVGGATYIASLISSQVSTQNIEPYSAILKRKAIARRLINASQRIQEFAYDDPDDPLLITKCEQELIAASERGTTSGFVTLHDAGERYLQQVEKVQSGKREMIGLPVGLIDFDYHTLGLQRKVLYVLAGAPSTGKTTLAMNMAENVGATTHSVAVFSIEMEDESLGEKVLSRGARLDSHAMRRGAFGKEGWTKLGQALEKLRGVKVFIHDKPRLDVVTMRAKMRRLKREHGLDLVIVDYLQLMSPRPRVKLISEYDIVSDNIAELKMLAKEFDVPVIVLSQLSRKRDEGPLWEGGRPNNTMLRSSGRIEEVADVIAFMYQPKKSRPKKGDPPAEPDNTVSILFTKNRRGPTGEFKLVYLKAEHRFESIAN